MQVSEDNPLDPFTLGRQVFSERLSYLFAEPKVGERVVFKNFKNNYFGIIAKISDVDNVKIYQIISLKNQQVPWEVSRDKIIARIYYPSVKSIDLDSIMQPTPSAPATHEYESAEWKKYESKVLNISFSYPHDWIIETNTNTSFIIKSPSNSILRLHPHQDESSTIAEFLPKKIS